MAFCPNCGTKMSDDARFCNNCGAKLTPAPTPAPDPSPVYNPPTQEPEGTETTLLGENNTPPPQGGVTPPPYGGYYSPPPQGGYTPPPSYSPVQTVQKPKNGSVGKILIFGGLAVILVVLCIVIVKLIGGGGLGFGTSSSPYVGTWNATEVGIYDYMMDIDDVYPGGFTIQLKSNGKCVLTVEGENYTGKWSYENGQMTVYGSGTNLSGEVNGSEMSLYWAEYEMTYIFVKEGGGTAGGVIAQPSEAPVADTSYIDWWDGDWYGWWIVENKSGTYEDWADDWWDCCARINVAETGATSIVFWDEYDTETTPTARFSATVDTSGMTVGTGTFMYMATTRDCFDVETDYEGVENLIRIVGHYEDSDGSFDFAIYLRPWGQLWDDWYAEDSECLTYYYYDWYLPLIEAGEPMPGEIYGD